MQFYKEAAEFPIHASCGHWGLNGLRASKWRIPCGFLPSRNRPREMAQSLTRVFATLFDTSMKTWVQSLELMQKKLSKVGYLA